MTTIIINEQHSLMENQSTLLEVTYPEGYETILVPGTGWDRDQMDEILKGLASTVVYVSPIPYMILKSAQSDNIVCRVMCNDKRVKKELPNGKVIQVVAQKGWYIA